MIIKKTKMNCELNDIGQEFLVYAYFGITKEDSDEIIIQKCVKKAYLDVCRTLRFKEQYKESKENKKEKDEKIKVICRDLTKKIYNNGNLIVDPNELFKFFLKKDNETIKDFGLKKYLKEDFHFGQAQKWVNMTLKYLYLLDFVNGEKMLELHIPIDNYIIEALREDGIKVPEKHWSKWNKKEYDKLLNNILPEHYLLWEHDNWIRIAEKKKRSK